MGFHDFEAIKTMYSKSLKEFARVLRDQGIVIFKCQDCVACGLNHFTHSWVMYEALKYGFYHPTEKPKEIIKKLIKTSSNKNDTILDPFMGSGTTCVACKELDRKCIGIEINKDYYEIAKKRIFNTQRSMF